MSLGRRLASPRFSLSGRSGLFSAVEDFSQPFTFVVVTPVNHAATAAYLLTLLPRLIAAMWLCGFSGPTQIGSRASGQVMQWPPPRPLPISDPSIDRTAIPALRIRAFVYSLRS